jgi:chemotaxis protein MotA
MKPDLATIVGITLGVGGILLGQHIEGGKVESILQPTAALIVFGGTFGATMISYPLPVFLAAWKKIIDVFTGEEEDLAAMARELIEFAIMSRRDGLLALQQPLNEIADPFIKKGLQLVIDGTQEKALVDMLETDISAQEEVLETYAKVFETAGGYAPTIGIIGAVLGLIHVMENLSDPSKLGAGIACAFVATVYGVGSANLFFLPAASKLKGKKEEHTKRLIIILEAITGMQKGDNPTLLKERLRGLLPENQKKNL